jgi:FAD/FMN-containing dehydrogenase
MALVSRRHFARQMALAAAFCGRPLWAINESHRLFDADKQNGAPPDPQMICKLASRIVGQVITPEAADYDPARSIFNRAFNRRPAVIVRCGRPSDVARSLDFAQAQNLPLAERAGGLSRLGFGMCDGGVVIDLTAMKRVEIDISKRVARAGAGALVRDFDTATQHFGLATTSGGCPTVGIAGFTLGGGEGRLMEKYGAACDNLLSAQW